MVKFAKEIGSSGRIRTYNPPVSGQRKAGGRTRGFYVPVARVRACWYGVFGKELFRDCSEPAPIVRDALVSKNQVDDSRMSRGMGASARTNSRDLGPPAALRFQASRGEVHGGRRRPLRARFKTLRARFKTRSRRGEACFALRRPRSAPTTSQF